MNRRVLLAIHNTALVEPLHALLVERGLEVTVAHQGPEALARFTQLEPALVVCEDHLPTLSANDVVHQIKVQSPEVKVVVALTKEARVTADTRSSLGCDEVVLAADIVTELDTLLMRWSMVEQPLPLLTLPIPIAVPAPTDPAKSVDEAPRAPVSPVPITPPSVWGPILTPLDLLPPAQPPIPPPRPAPDAAVAEAVASFVRSFDHEDDTIVSGPQSLVGLRAQRAAVIPSGIPSVGDRASLSLPSLLYRLYISSFSGVIALDEGEECSSVFLWGGFPVRVEDVRGNDRFLATLLRRGTIDKVGRDKAEALVQSAGLRPADALLKLGLLNDRKAVDALREANEDRLINTLDWRRGAYRLEARIDFADDTAFGEIHPLAVIWRGIHKHYPMHDVLEVLGPLRARHIVTTGLFADRLAALRPLWGELDVESLLADSSTFGELLDRGARGASPNAYLLYFLLITEMVEAVPAPHGIETESGLHVEGSTEDSCGGAVADEHFRAGLGLLGDGCFSEAQGRLEKAIAAQPQCARYWVSLAQAILLDPSAPGDMARHGALNCLRRACAIDPRDDRAKFQLGKLLLESGIKEEARQHFREVLTLRADHSEARKLLGNLERRSG